MGRDSADTVTRALDGREPPRFVAALDSNALRGAGLGILRNLFSNTEIIDHGLHHAALHATFRLRDSIQTRDSDAYAQALGKQ